MQHRVTAPLGRVFLMCFALMLSSGCGMYNITSTWCNRAVVVDGLDTPHEWDNAMFIIEKKKVTIGLLNNDHNLYLRLSFHDLTTQHRILTHGMTVWLNDTGKKDKMYGIHFPIGMRRGEHQEGRPEMPRGSIQHVDEAVKKMVISSTQNLEIIGPSEKSKMTVSRTEADSLGITASIDYTKGNLVYEMKVPLICSESSPWGISKIIRRK